MMRFINLTGISSPFFRHMAWFGQSSSIGCLLVILIFLESCSHRQEVKSYDSIDVQTTYDIADSKFKESKAETPNGQCDSISINTIPREIWLNDLEKFEEFRMNDSIISNIYTTYRELPDEMKLQLVANERLLLKNISTRCWEGYIKESFDNGKLSFRAYKDTTFYTLSRKLIIDITNRETGKNIKTEISRENVTKDTDEEYAQYNICSWEIEKLTTEYLEVSATITLLDSDIGDDITIKITKEGKYSIQRKNTLDSME